MPPATRSVRQEVQPFLRVNSATANSLGTNAINFDGTGNASTARLELVNSSLANSINLAGRTNASIAIQHLSGNSTVSGTVTIGTGGNIYNVQSDSGTLNLSNVTISTGARTLTLGGAGDINVAGVVSNGGGTMSLTNPDWER